MKTLVIQRIASSNICAASFCQKTSTYQSTHLERKICTRSQKAQTVDVARTALKEVLEVDVARVAMKIARMIELARIAVNMVMKLMNYCASTCVPTMEILPLKNARIALKEVVMALPAFMFNICFCIA